MSETRLRTVVRIAALALLLTLSAAVVSAAPPSETGKSRSPFAGDTRLEKRVTLEFAKTPLNEALTLACGHRTGNANRVGHRRLRAHRRA